MAPWNGFRRKGSEAVPKIFQTFNSLLGSIVRKKNATIVGPSKQLVGEFPPVTFDRLFEFYHHWDQIKRSVDTSHQKLVGAGIEIKSNNEYFNVFIEKWWNEVNAGKKFSEFFLSGLVTGNAIMEIQYTSDGRVGNIEHIPMQTIFRIFRDQFANELKLVQVVDGVFKELDPEYFMHWMINNPDRQAFGKSEFFSVASPRPVATKVDKFTGQPVNPDRNLRSLLDAQAILQNAEVEIKEKMGKPRLLVSAPGMPRDQMNEVQSEMADPSTDQYIWIFDKPVESTELQIQNQTRFDDYGDNVDAHIDIATGFASKVISNPSGFSYSGSQTPLDVLDQRMIDMQKDSSELLIDGLLKPLAESWGFKEFEEMEVEVTFTPNVKRLTMEDIRGLDPESVAPKEKRKMYEKLNIPLDDQLYDEFQNELKSDKQDQKDVGMAQATANGFGGGEEGGGSPMGGGGESPAGGDAGKPNAPPSAGGQSEKSGAGQSDVPEIKPLEATPVKPDSEEDRPAPTRTDKQEPSPFRKKKGEALTTDDIGTIVEKTVKALAQERIPLPPKAGSNANSSVDLYVSQGLDTPGKPEITDPKIRQTYGEDDEDEEDLPPNAPQRQAHVGDTPVLDPNQPNLDLIRQEKKQGAGDFTNQGDVGIPQVDSNTGQPISEPPAVGINDYVKELEGKVQGDHTQGGTGDQRINQDSDGSFKDPLDLAKQQEEPAEPEVGQQTQSTNISPRAPEPDELGRSISGGYQPDEPDLKQLGSPDNDEQPFEKSEGFPKDNDPEELEKLTNRQNLHEGVGDKYPNVQQLPDAPETPHRDMVKPEDSDPRLPYEDPNPELNQPQVGQARLNDTPLQETPTNDPDGIAPSMEDPHDLKNNTDQAGGDGNAVEPAGGIGQTDQQRLREDELTGSDQAGTLPTIGDSPLDNTGLNMKPDAVGGVVEDPQRDQITGITDPVLGQPDLQDNTIQDPIGEVPHDDGMLVKPEDTQQILPEQGQQPLDPQQGGIDAPAPNADPNQGTNIDQGVDPNEIDPNQLHIDPDTNKMYTDQTDEQGNEVPDLRFDQTPDSDEKQPDVELENEIVTKEEYEQELAGKRASNAPPPAPLPEPPLISEDQFNAELDKQSTDPNEPNVFDNTTPKEPEGRVSKMLNQEEPEEDGWEPVFKEDKEKPELSEVVADAMRVQSEQVFVNPDGKVIGAPRFYDNRKKKGQSRETGTSAGAKKGWDTRGRGRKQEPTKSERGAVNDSRLRERGQAISDVTSTYPKQFDHARAEQQAIKAEKIQDQHYPRVKEVYNNLSNEFPNVEITGRVKDTKSMIEKLARKPDEYKDVSEVKDVSALRTLCKDLKEVGSVASYIRENFDVADEDNYIQKPNGGYRSIHMEIRDKNGLVSEIQVRTPNQNKWAIFFHDKFYKPIDDDLKAFVESHYSTIDDYAQRMSDYYFKQDNGEDVEVPECPSEIIEMIGCVE